MSDMSFKQAKELAEQLELSEVTLKELLNKIDIATKNFDDTLKKQESIVYHIPKNDKKLTYMKILIGINIGFILGLVSVKYIL